MVFQPKRKTITLDSFSIKRRKLCKIDEVPVDVFKSIFKRCGFIDIVQGKAVCSSWNILGEEVVSNTPLLMLPSKEEVEKADATEVNNNTYSGFLKPGATQICSMKRLPKELRESCCIGSSKGWLVFLGEKAVPSLFHPFRQITIQLPSLILDSVAGLQRVERKVDGEYDVDYFLKEGNSRRLIVSYPLTKQMLREWFIRKAVLINGNINDNYGVILLCKDGSIVYHRRGDSGWTELVPASNYLPYQDIITSGDRLLALISSNDRDRSTLIMDIWDFRGGCMIRRDMSILPPYPSKSLAKEASLQYPCTTRLYLVESCGDVLLVVRFIGEFVDGNGDLFEEGDADCIRPYKTLLFHVYKLDSKEQKWVEMECLGNNRALFVGGNHSVSVPVDESNCEGNSIYFTDDYWERMEEDYLYGGHDMGIYNLKAKSVKPVYEFTSDQIQPPPCWIIPCPNGI